ncbi:MAG TPA: sigma-70 family RNA polymerase sigma factor [Bacteroidia bacterium]|nr:sigma-70 family RNA polymerase sigma factor [Bacteroidia bacterium]
MRYEEDNFYIDKILKGDDASFALLVDKHKTMAYNIAFRILKSREDAEEIAQDSFLKAYHSLKEFKRESKFSTWLYRIIYNNSISRIRKKKLDTHSYNDEEFEWMEPAETARELDKLHHLEQKKYVNEALDKLPGEDATVISLFYMNESSVEEISEVTGLSQSNVKVKLHRSRKKLYDELHLLLKEELNEIV